VIPIDRAALAAPDPGPDQGEAREAVKRAATLARRIRTALDLFPGTPECADWADHARSLHRVAPAQPGGDQ